MKSIIILTGLLIFQSCASINKQCQSENNIKSYGSVGNCISEKRKQLAKAFESMSSRNNTQPRTVVCTGSTFSYGNMSNYQYTCQ